jgi:hypothetical protein
LLHVGEWDSRTAGVVVEVHTLIILAEDKFPVPYSVSYE